MNNKKDSIAVTPRQQNIVLKTPYGHLHIERIDAHDHASMKANQLKAALVLISGEGQQNFSELNADLQNSFFWMLQQAASELDQLLDQVEFADVEVAK
ncbi:MAG: hypothetical protein M3Y65_10540 [Pseudomonadota bacterium]|nr:hypothetical protein [Pseudomonadota bacterium]